MDKVLNQKLIESIATDLKVDAVELQKLLEDEKVIENYKEELKSSVTIFWSNEDKETFETNWGKEKYDEGKVAGMEMPFKEYKKANYPDTTSKDFSELINSILENTVKDKETALEKLKGELGGDVDEQVLKLNKDKEELDEKILKLQGTIGENETKHKGELETLNQSILTGKTNDTLNKAIAGLNISVGDIKEEKAQQEFLSRERNNLAVLFKNNHTMEYGEDNKLIISKNGEKLLDGTQSPMTLEDIILPFAKENYVQLDREVQSGRGGDDSKIVIKGAANIKSNEDFNAYIKDNDIQPNTPESDAVWTEAKKYNPELGLAK